jgi:hypothetical protein
MSSRFNNINNLKRVEVSIPRDEEGYLGRECPQPDCEGYFKIKPGTGLTGENLPCVCPYCGHSGPHDTFFTKEQIEYARSFAIRKATEALRMDLKAMEFTTKPAGPLGLSISMKLQPGHLPALQHYREKALETKVTCDSCTLDYSVFGVFAYCPDCAAHNSLLILRSNLDLIDRQLALAEGIEDAALRTHLIEDALENCVSSFDGFAREACSIRGAKSTNPKKCSNLSFQNLKRASENLDDLFSVDLASSVSSTDWEMAHTRFLQRHLLAHKSGVIDQRFINDAGTRHDVVGRKVAVTIDEVRQLLTVIDSIGTYLIASLPKPVLPG